MNIPQRGLSYSQEPKDTTMRKGIYIAMVVILGAVSNALDAQQSFHDFSVTDIQGNEFNLAQLQGKKVLVVNTASECGLTPQFKGLQSLYEKFGDGDFVIIGFPTNDFGKQDPGTNDEIAAFCQDNYGVSFPMMAKITVKGEEIHPLYKWLTTASENGVSDSRVAWNFQKYMIDESGHLVGHVPPRKKPECREIVSWIKKG